jgi:hypothetical protein
LTINEEEEKPLLVLVPPHQYIVRSTYKVDGKTGHQDQYRLSKQTKTKRARLYTPCSKTLRGQMCLGSRKSAVFH